MAVVIFQVLLWLLGKRNIAKHVMNILPKAVITL